VVVRVIYKTIAASAAVTSKTCSLPSPPSRPSACLAPVRLTTKGLPLQLAMALCNAQRDSSAFSAHPRLAWKKLREKLRCSGSASLMVLSTMASPGTHPNAHWRLFVGHERTRSDRALSACWFFPRRRLRKLPLEQIKDIKSKSRSSYQVCRTPASWPL
jgi:hypothetical protein